MTSKLPRRTCYLVPTQAGERCAVVLTILRFASYSNLTHVDLRVQGVHYDMSTEIRGLPLSKPAEFPSQGLQEMSDSWNMEMGLGLRV